MRRLLVCLALASAAMISAAEDRVDLKAGDQAPAVELQATDGKAHSLEQFAGKSSVALVWFLRAGSSGSKTQLAAFQAKLADIAKHNVQVLGITTSSLKECQDFAEELGLSFPLLSDTDGSVAKAYGALRGGTGPMCERWVFLIDDQGVIRNIEKGQAVADKANLLLATLDGQTQGDPAKPAVAPTAALRPGTTITVDFPDMPPTFWAISQQTTKPARMSIFLPKDYDAQRQYPLFVCLAGGDGGAGESLGVPRALVEDTGFVCVNMPLFRADATRPPADMVMRDPDARAMWPHFRTMLDKLDQMVPNLDPAHRVLGGFSNGAHATQGLLDESDGEVARRFSAILFVEGGGRLRDYTLLKGKPFAMVSSNAKSRPRAQEIADAATAAGAKTTFIFYDIGQHGFPPGSYDQVRAWLRGPGLE